MVINLIMKINRPALLFVVLMIISLNLVLVNVQANDYNYSVKNRWTIKTSISSYKTAFVSNASVVVGDNFIFFQNRRMVNFKLEANYGVNRFIEIGIFTGFQHYEWLEDYSSEDLNKGFAPLFGVNANFQILPFFVKSKNCHWDLYLTAKYGGCYLPHNEIDQPDFLHGKYRHEYGLGLGIGYYFKNIIGFFAEGSVGQYFLFHRFERGIVIGNSLAFKNFSDSNFSFRIGVTAQF